MNGFNYFKGSYDHNKTPEQSFLLFVSVHSKNNTRYKTNKMFINSNSQHRVNMKIQCVYSGYRGLGKMSKY